MNPKRFVTPVRVDLGVIAMKGYSTYPDLKPCHGMQFDSGVFFYGGAFSFFFFFFFFSFALFFVFFFCFFFSLCFVFSFCESEGKNEKNPKNKTKKRKSFSVCFSVVFLCFWFCFCFFCCFFWGGIPSLYLFWILITRNIFSTVKFLVLLVSKKNMRLIEQILHLHKSYGVSPMSRMREHLITCTWYTHSLVHL